MCSPAVVWGNDPSTEGARQRGASSLPPINPIPSTPPFLNRPHPQPPPASPGSLAAIFVPTIHPIYYWITVNIGLLNEYLLLKLDFQIREELNTKFFFISKVI